MSPGQGRGGGSNVYCSFQADRVSAESFSAPHPGDGADAAAGGHLLTSWFVRAFGFGVADAVTTNEPIAGDQGPAAPRSTQAVGRHSQGVRQIPPTSLRTALSTAMGFAADDRAARI
jgi:hypothetical protein